MYPNRRVVLGMLLQVRKAQGPRFRLAGVLIMTRCRRYLHPE